MAALLKDAMKPNLVQTAEGNPVFVHGGPFANIAHGTSSVVAADLALDLADYVVTECGFGSDLGMVKFFDIVVRMSPLPPPDACVLVATVRSLKYHGGVKREDLETSDIPALEKGFSNLQKHIENLRFFGVPFVVALNRFSSDTDEEIEKVMDLCRKEGVRIALSEVFSKGGQGGVTLAEEVIQAIDKDAHNFQSLYPQEMPLVEKIEVIAKKMFGAAAVAMEGKIRRRIRRIEREGFQNLPVCIAKTQYSLSDDDQLLGRPEGFTMIVTDASLSSGAGFVVVHCGDIMTMPGLPKVPAAEKIDVTPEGKITGLS
jgi:formate--tetrahydrofolate ligase